MAIPTKDFPIFLLAVVAALIADSLSSVAVSAFGLWKNSSPSGTFLAEIRRARVKSLVPGVLRLLPLVFSAGVVLLGALTIFLQSRTGMLPQQLVVLYIVITGVAIISNAVLALFVSWVLVRRVAVSDSKELRVFNYYRDDGLNGLYVGNLAVQSAAALLLGSQLAGFMFYFGFDELAGFTLVIVVLAFHAFSIITYFFRVSAEFRPTIDRISEDDAGVLR